MPGSVQRDIFIRSILFLLAVGGLTVLSVFLLPLALIVPRTWVRTGTDIYIHTGLWLLRRVCKLDYVVRGTENIPNTPVLFASKHLSLWESVVLPTLLNDPAAVLRSELARLIFFGQIMVKLGNIIVDRAGGISATSAMLMEADQQIRSGRSVLIFPEGTRTLTRPFPRPHYKRGVVALYRKLNVPCVPVALNSGLFWPTQSLRLFPGTITVDILPPIPPGLDSGAFLQTLIERIETSSRSLVEQAARLSSEGDNRANA